MFSCLKIDFSRHVHALFLFDQKQYISFLVLRRIASIRSYLTESTTAQLVSSFITSRLDHCNSIFAGLPATEIFHLQGVLNKASWLVLGKSNRHHVSLLLQHLHWLPNPAWIDDKVATLAYCHLTAHYYPTFLQLLSLTIPLAHSWCLDITLLAIRPLSSGTHFHLQSVSCLLLLIFHVYT